MKNHTRSHKRGGSPGFRTPSSFRFESQRRTRQKPAKWAGKNPK